ncbi:hypothetical protein, partial [Microbispora sp. KK1-11]|uniref:hypothetical protein n=1 Tax=Microbispora sp. KK1-11 TaxID=2053005 RepID=UPI001C8E4998
AIAFFSFDLDFAITKDHAMAVLISRRHASTSGNSYTTPVDATLSPGANGVPSRERLLCDAYGCFSVSGFLGKKELERLTEATAGSPTGPLPTVGRRSATHLADAAAARVAPSPTTRRE